MGKSTISIHFCTRVHHKKSFFIPGARPVLLPVLAPPPEGRGMLGPVGRGRVGSSIGSIASNGVILDCCIWKKLSTETQICWKEWTHIFVHEVWSFKHPLDVIPWHERVVFGRYALGLTLHDGRDKPAHHAVLPPSNFTGISF